MELTAENYYSQEMNKQFMSVSQFKDFLNCEDMAMAKISGKYEQPKTTALLVGSYVDAYFEGTLDRFIAENADILIKRNGELRAEYIQANIIIERVKRDKLFMDFMSGEKQKIFTAELFGAEWKIKIDSLCKDKIVDLKCMRSLSPVMGVSFITHWMYDTQLAVYQEVYYRATGKRLEAYIAACTKETVTDLEVIRIPQWRLDECLENVKKHMPHILAVKNGDYPALRCGICDWCKQSKILTEPIDFESVGFKNEEV